MLLSLTAAVTSDVTVTVLLVAEEAPIVVDLVGSVVDAVDVMMLCGVVTTSGVTGKLLLSVDEEPIVVDVVESVVDTVDVMVL